MLLCSFFYLLVQFYIVSILRNFSTLCSRKLYIGPWTIASSDVTNFVILSTNLIFVKLICPNFLATFAEQIKWQQDN